MSSEQLSLTLAPGIQFSRRDLILPETLTVEEWMNVGRVLFICGSELEFLLAKWKAYGGRRFGMPVLLDAIKQFEKENDAGQLRFDIAGLKQADVLNHIVDNWTPGLEKEHHFVLAKAHLDEQGRDMWIKMAEKEHLSPRELQESIRMGSVTRIKIDPDKDRGVGFASFESWYLQWKLLRKQIEDVRRDWNLERCEEAMTYLDPPAEFRAEVKERIQKLKELNATANVG
jgi:hypothetical protein